MPHLPPAPSRALRVAFLVAALSLPGLLAAAPTRLWATYLGGPGDDRIHAVSLAPDGDLLVCGNTTGDTLAGRTPTLIGRDDPSRLAFHGGFLAKLSPDGRSLRWIRRFGRGAVFLTDAKTDGTRVYAAGVATAFAQDDLVAPFRGYDRSAPLLVKSEYTGALTSHAAPDTYRSILIQLDADASTVTNATWLGEPTPGRESHGIGDIVGSWYASTDLWQYLKQREAWAFSTMNPYTINRLALLPGGDVLALMDGGLRWAGGQDSLYRFRAGDLSSSGLRWKRVFDAAGNNSTLATPEHASVLSADLALSPDGRHAYVAGGSNGWTGAEPYWNPFLFKFDVEDGTQLWARDGIAGGGPYGPYNILMPSVGSNQADSYGQAVAVNEAGDPLVAFWADGGNSFLMLDPWRLGGTAANQDGDGFFGFKARTFAPVLGRYAQDGVSGWRRSHRVKPNPNTNPDQNATLFLAVSPVPGRPEEMMAVGWTFGMAQVDPWDAATGKGLVARLVLADSGTTRAFVDRVPGVEEFHGIVAHRGVRTYTAAGYALAGAPLLGALQATHAGSEDGYLMTFTDEVAVEGGVASVVEVALVPGGLRVTLVARVARTFRLQRSTDLGRADPWALLPGVSATATSVGQQLVLEVPEAQLPAFFRILAE